MKKHSRLIKKVELFSKVAQDLASMKGMVEGIKQEVAGCIRSINNLFQKDRKYGESKALQYLDDNLSELSNLAANFDYTDPAYSLKSLNDKLSGMYFYTAKANAGVGFDPLTRDGDEHSPGAYLDRIKSYIDKLTVMSKQLTKG